MKRNSILFVAALAVVLFFIGFVSDNFVLRMIAKPIPLLAFLTLLKPNTPYRKYIFAGLSFSILGDILLESSPDMFIYGLLAFLIAQIAYIIAFTTRSHQTPILSAIIMLVFGAGIYWVLYPGLNDMTIPVLVYLLVIITMAWRAISQGKFDKYAIYAVIGSYFFVLSDSLIALDKFYMVIPYSRWMIMLSYWTAQSLIFYSAYRSSE